MSVEISRTIGSLKGYRTIIFNSVSLIVIVANYLVGVVSDSTWIEVFMAVVAVGNLYLRTITDTAVGKGTEPAPGASV